MAEDLGGDEEAKFYSMMAKKKLVASIDDDGHLVRNEFLEALDWLKNVIIAKKIDGLDPREQEQWRHCMTKMANETDTLEDREILIELEKKRKRETQQS